MTVAEITRRTPLADLPELLRVDEAAAWAGVSRGVIYEMARAGTLRCTKLGRLTRISRAALDAWVNGSNGHSLHDTDK